MWWMYLLFFILVYFLLFYPSNLPEKWKFQKNEKKGLKISSFHKCTKSHDHMVYCSWDMACDGCNYFSFWATLCPFTLLTAQKNKISKKWKKCLEISFYTCVPQIMSRWCTVPKIWCATDRCRWTDRQTEKVTHRGGRPT